jgi:hypothetical protein
MTPRTDESKSAEGCGAEALPQSHPGHGLVSSRKFARLRSDGLIPRPIRRVRRSTGYGSSVEYPAWTRSQLEHQRALEEAGIRGADKQRILLWIEGYPIPSARVVADLKSISDSALQFAARARRDLEADRIVLEALDRHGSSQLIKWARELLPERSDLETALLQMVQLASGTPPPDLMLDPDSAGPIRKLLGDLVPGVEASAAELASAMSLDDHLANFMRAAATFPEWSPSDWTQAREDQLVFRQLTGWQFPTIGTVGDLLFASRFAFLIACGAMRQIDRDEWEASIREMKATLIGGLSGESPITSDLNSQEAC